MSPGEKKIDDPDNLSISTIINIIQINSVIIILS